MDTISAHGLLLRKLWLQFRFFITSADRPYQLCSDQFAPNILCWPHARPSRGTPWPLPSFLRLPGEATAMDNICGIYRIFGRHARSGCDAYLGPLSPACVQASQ